MQPSSKQLRQQQKQRQTPVATPTSKHTAAASAASSAVQLLKDELAHKLHAAVQRSSPGVKVWQRPSLQPAACETAVSSLGCVVAQPDCKLWPLNHTWWLPFNLWKIPARPQQQGLLLLHLSKLQAGAAASALVADLAAAQQAQAQLEDRLLAAQAALLQQKQQHRHDVSHDAVVH
jgi:hypothetical protein